jgi:hypothetical protein
MKIKSQLTLAILLVTSMFAVGCQQVSSGSQQVASGSQQVAGSQQTQTTTGGTTTKGGSTGSVKAKAGSCNPKTDKWCHSHPAIPGCTDSYMHSHAYNNPKHTHTYGCKGGKVKIKGHTGGKIKLPHVKAKGVYKGAVSMNSASREVMKQYQR